MLVDKLRAVLDAKKRWLKPNGCIIPDRAQLYVSGIADTDFKENNIDWWENVYGYNMADNIDHYLKYARIKIVPNEDVSNCILISINSDFHNFKLYILFCLGCYKQL